MTPIPKKIAFIGIGAGKAGTSWLHDMLRQHPQLYLPSVKEVHYFNDVSYEGDDVTNPNFSKPLSWYFGCFAGAEAGQLCGEISPSYIWSRTAPERIHNVAPDVRIIAMLRNPIQRTFSAYLFGQQKGEIASNVSFERALEEFDHLVSRSLYCQNLRRYFELFPRQQIKVVFDHELLADPRTVLADVQRFIGVPVDIPPDVEERRNVTATSRYPRITHLLMQHRIQLKRQGLERVVEMGKVVGLARIFRYFQSQVRTYEQKPKIHPATEESLRARFISEIECLEGLLGVDLAHWKAPAAGSAPVTSAP